MRQHAQRHTRRKASDRKKNSRQLTTLRTRLKEAENVLEALRSGKADAVLGAGSSGDRILKLEGTEDPYRLMVETMGEGAITLTPEGIILYCNKRFAEMTDHEQVELVGTPLSNMLASSCDDTWLGILPTRPDQIKREHLQLQRPSGKLLPIQVTVRSLALSGVHGMVAIITDLTELQKASQAKDRFFAKMSHELRTPLTGILGYIGILLMKLPGPLTAAQEKQLSVVKASGQHLLALLNNLLDVSKIESEKVEISFERLSSRAIVNEVAEMLRPLASAKGLTLDLEVPNQDIVILSDRRAVSQILINLVGNSIKFTKSGWIRLEVDRNQSSGRTLTSFSVLDTGCGIAPELKRRLFQAFTHVDPIFSSPQDGTGLGLYISQKLAALIGAEITFESVLNHGSRFTLAIEDLNDQH